MRVTKVGDQRPLHIRQRFSASSSTLVTKVSMAGGASRPSRIRPVSGRGSMTAVAAASRDGAAACARWPMGMTQRSKGIRSGAGRRSWPGRRAVERHVRPRRTSVLAGKQLTDVAYLVEELVRGGEVDPELIVLLPRKACATSMSSSMTRFQLSRYSRSAVSAAGAACSSGLRQSWQTKRNGPRAGVENRHR